ncbi:hypothetical protein KIL84_003868 [Mauremys mutica]|uniref:Uncharacterized protein n=1 Tax=Mauremys mutica TaxID=74926 RepID=A0A9D3WWX6_9SAUR|nr:hypothetical protein KIL84_003868 [Mauremys mutica]
MAQKPLPGTGPRPRSPSCPLCPTASPALGRTPAAPSPGTRLEQPPPPPAPGVTFCVELGALLYASRPGEGAQLGQITGSSKVGAGEVGGTLAGPEIGLCWG